MPNITDDEVSDYLEHFVHDERYQNAGWDEWRELGVGHETIMVPDLGGVTLVKDEMQDSAYTAAMHIVLKVEFWNGNSAHYRVDGTYRSYDGSSWDTKAYRVMYGQRKVLDWIAVTDA